MTAVLAQQPLDLESYMVEAEAAGDRYQRLVVAAAVARADYEQAWEEAKLRSPATSIAGRNADADSAAVGQKRLWLIAEARERAARTHVSVVLGLMVAAQSRQKFAGAQDGGGAASDNWKPGW